MIQAQIGDVVRVSYKIAFQNGQIYDQKWDDESIVLTLGEGVYIKGFEEAILGMNLNSYKKIVIPFYKAFGPKDPLLIKEISKKLLPESITPTLGRRITITDPQGHQASAKITEIQDDTITLDANPDVANQDLICEIKLLEFVLE